MNCFFCDVDRKDAVEEDEEEEEDGEGTVEVVNNEKSSVLVDLDILLVVFSKSLNEDFVGINSFSNFDDNLLYDPSEPL